MSTSPETSTTSDTNSDDEPPPPMPPPQFPTRDWVGPADKKSNLRQVIWAQPEHESKAEREYREMRTATHEWNHQFWAQQNERFIKAKEEFVNACLSQKQTELENLAESEDTSTGIKQVLSAEEMAMFYQQFLKDNQEEFRQYNRNWYRRNFALLWPATKANIFKLINNSKR